MNQARSLRKHSPTKSHPRDKTGKKLTSRDFVASDWRQQLFDHDSCESVCAGSSLINGKKRFSLITLLRINLFS